MTLLTVVFAAIFCTVLWYRMAPQDEMKVSVLCWIFWGASLMWLVDAVFAYMSRERRILPRTAEMLNDWFLEFPWWPGTVVWLVILLVRTQGRCEGNAV